MSLTRDGMMITIDTSKRLGAMGTTSNFLVKVDLPYNSNFDSVALIEAQLPKAWHMIALPENYFNLNAVNLFFTEGSYTIDTFAVELKKQLDSAGPAVFTVVFNYVTWKWEITVDTGNPSILLGDTPVLARMLGMAVDSTNVFVGSKLVSTRTVDFNRHRTLTLTSEMATNHTNSNVLHTFHTRGLVHGDVLTYRNNDIERSAKTLATANSTVFVFTLEGDDNKPIEMNGVDWSFTILCYK